MRHTLDPTLKFSVSMVPVQSAPANVIIVDDITREAEARSAVPRKIALNCMIVGWRSF